MSLDPGLFILHCMKLTLAKHIGRHTYLEFESVEPCLPSFGVQVIMPLEWPMGGDLPPLGTQYRVAFTPKEGIDGVE